MTDNKIPCQNTECKGVFKDIVAPFYGYCPECKIGQDIKPIPCHQKVYDMDRVYGTLWNVLDSLQLVELALVQRGSSDLWGSNTIELGDTLNKLTDLVRYINPHRKLPSVYADDDNMDVAEIYQYME